MVIGEPFTLLRDDDDQRIRSCAERFKDSHKNSSCTEGTSESHGRQVSAEGTRSQGPLRLAQLRLMSSMVLMLSLFPGSAGSMKGKNFKLD